MTLLKVLQVTLIPARTVVLIARHPREVHIALDALDTRGVQLAQTLLMRSDRLKYCCCLAIRKINVSADIQRNGVMRPPVMDMGCVFYRGFYAHRIHHFNSITPQLRHFFASCKISNFRARWSRGGALAFFQNAVAVATPIRS